MIGRPVVFSKEVVSPSFPVDTLLVVMCSLVVTGVLCMLCEEVHGFPEAVLV